MSSNAKLKVYKVIYCPILTYGSESWVLSNNKARFIFCRPHEVSIQNKRNNLVETIKKRTSEKSTVSRTHGKKDTKTTTTVV